MKINSDSLKEDVTKLMAAIPLRGPHLTSTGRDLLDIFTAAAIEFGVGVIDHDKLETAEDLEGCTRMVVSNVQTAVYALLCRVVVKA